jgi:hypothetical protein
VLLGMPRLSTGTPEAEGNMELGKADRVCVMPAEEEPKVLVGDPALPKEAAIRAAAACCCSALAALVGGKDISESSWPFQCLVEGIMVKTEGKGSGRGRR